MLTASFLYLKYYFSLKYISTYRLNDVLHSHVHDINKSKIENECKMVILLPMEAH